MRTRIDLINYIQHCLNVNPRLIDCRKVDKCYYLTIRGIRKPYRQLNQKEYGTMMRRFPRCIIKIKRVIGPFELWKVRYQS